MLKLHSCIRGHFWEASEDAAFEADRCCPDCGAPAEDVPLLALAPAEPPPARPVEPIDLPLLDGDGRPVVSGFEIHADLGRSRAGIRHYRARQEITRREVVLAVVLASEDPTSRAWSCLRGEATALGQLSHPNIRTIHEAGERGRQLFYNVLESAGPTLAEVAADQPQPLAATVCLVELLARAVEHARSRGIAHRNLEPSQVLLRPTDPDEAVPGDESAGAHCTLSSGRFLPLLTGFGLARRPVESDPTDAPLYADPGFLSPEQAWGRTKDLGPATDVYGLGGILYYLLTGRAPFRGPSLGDVIDAVQTAELRPPSALRRIPADLEAICLRCLARQPRRRYPRAGDLAEDLHRYALGLPVQARKTTGAVAAGRWLRRHPTFASLFFFVMLALAGSTVGYGLLVSERVSARHQVEAARAEVAVVRSQLAVAQQQVLVAQKRQQFTAYAAAVREARDALAGNRAAEAQRHLEACPDEPRRVEWYVLMQRALGVAGVRIALRDARQFGIAIDPQQGRYLASAQKREDGNGRGRGRVRVWDVLERTWSGIDLTTTAEARQVRFSADGSALAAITGRETGEVVLWQLGRPPVERCRHGNLGSPATGLAFAPYGSQLAVVLKDGSARLLDSDTATLLPFTLRQRGLVPRESGAVLCYRGDGGAIALGAPGTRQVFLVQNGSWALQLTIGSLEPAHALACAGELLAIARGESSIRLHDARHGRLLAELRGLPATVTHLVFNPQGDRLAAACANGVVRLWGRNDQEWVELLDVSADTSAGLAFADRGRLLIAAGEQAFVLLGAAP